MSAADGKAPPGTAELFADLYLERLSGEKICAWAVSALEDGSAELPKEEFEQAAREFAKSWLARENKVAAFRPSQWRAIPAAD